MSGAQETGRKEISWETAVLDNDNANDGDIKEFMALLERMNVDRNRTKSDGEAQGSCAAIKEELERIRGGVAEHKRRMMEEIKKIKNNLSPGAEQQP